jgi:predicted transcriptional regulator
MCVGRFEDIDGYVLASVYFCSGGISIRMPGFSGALNRSCCRAKIHAALFVLAQELEELAQLRRPYVWKTDVDIALERLVENGLLEERLEALKEIDGVRLHSRIHTYRLTRTGRIIAEDVLKEIRPKARERMRELLKMGVWSLIGYAYVQHPEQAVLAKLAVH